MFQGATSAPEPQQFSRLQSAVPTTEIYATVKADITAAALSISLHF